MATPSKFGEYHQGMRVRLPVILFANVSLSLAVLANVPARHPEATGSSEAASSTETFEQDQAAPKSTTALPRGKKLILKDGDFQLVREYHVEGDRVRYYSVDSRQWEEMPAALVDWDATRKVEAEEARVDAARVAKVHALEEARKGQ